VPEHVPFASGDARPLQCHMILSGVYSLARTYLRALRRSVLPATMFSDGSEGHQSRHRAHRHNTLGQLRNTRTSLLQGTQSLHTRDTGFPQLLACFLTRHACNGRPVCADTAIQVSVQAHMMTSLTSTHSATFSLLAERSRSIACLPIGCTRS
jgi:hypothetical protein